MTDPRIERIAQRQAAQTIATQVTVAPLLDAETLSDEQVTAVTAAFPVWSADSVKVGTGDYRSHDGILYRCVQGHVTQADWTPDATPALWVPARKTAGAQPDEWKAPTGAQDAYNTGDRVTFEGAVWESVIDANVWSPSAHPAGWKKG